MLVTPLHVYKLFEPEASARDGRFTRRCLPNPSWTFDNPDLGQPLYTDVCEYGPILAGSPLTWFTWPSRTVHEQRAREAEIDAAATLDDAVAWAYAARWWLNFAEEWYAYALAHPTKGVDFNGPNLQPSRRFWFDHGGDLVEHVVGGQDYLVNENGEPMLLANATWPLYFASMKAQIVVKGFQRRVSLLIHLQIVCKYIARLMSTGTAPVRDGKFLKLATTPPKKSLDEEVDL